MSRSLVSLALAAVLAGTAPLSARAVRLAADGIGQALIFPYYTVRDGRGGTFNTYVSIVNHTADGKALRVRFRESRNGVSVAEFNVYLGAKDVWTGAIFPDAGGASVSTLDLSCTDPSFGIIGGVVAFGNGGFSGANDDGAGTTRDRTREGWIEVLEMATLKGNALADITLLSVGAGHANCLTPRVAPADQVVAPTGGLAGSLTLINVADGADYSMNAEALADLASAPYFRVPTDAYPAFTAAEIDPVSVMVDKGAAYRSVWARGLDAVNAALIRSTVVAEFVLDPAVAAATDIVLTFPTRRETAAAAPFANAGGWQPACVPVRTAEFGVLWSNRESNMWSSPEQFFGVTFPGEHVASCAASTVLSVKARSADPSLLGSAAGGNNFSEKIAIPPSVSNGYVKMMPSGLFQGYTSLPASTRVDLATGAVTTGAHVYSGLPIVGMMLRSLRNGTLTCGASACQGNYGGAFPLRFMRTVSP